MTSDDARILVCLCNLSDCLSIRSKRQQNPPLRFLFSASSSFLRHRIAFLPFLRRGCFCFRRFHLRPLISLFALRQVAAIMAAPVSSVPPPHPPAPPAPFLPIPLLLLLRLFVFIVARLLQSSSSSSIFSDQRHPIVVVVRGSGASLIVPQSQMSVRLSA